MNETGNDNYLLTPGPLTTSLSTKKAMLRDWGSRNQDFIALTRRVCTRLVRIAGVSGTHVAVPIQGSGTFGIEATLGTLIARDVRTLVLVNGAYGTRMVAILEHMGRDVSALEWPENQAVTADALDAALSDDRDIAYVAAVHCETTSGILNPIAAIAEVTARHRRGLIIDSMSAFGAIPLAGAELNFDALVASSNKCLEGVPGLAFAILREQVLADCEGNAHSLSLDLHAQWRGLLANGQWRFTPPTHVLAAFDQALREHEAEGGVEGRNARYSENCRILIEGMRRLGFETLLGDEVQAPIIVTFLMPADPGFDFARFYDALSDRGFVIYPGKLTVADSFRIGCIGQVGPKQMHQVLSVIESTLGELGVQSGAPATAS